jgi:hypothetical protein
MPDKYSYKPGKKKKVLRRPGIIQPIEAAAQTAATAPAAPVAAAVKTSAAAIKATPQAASAAPAEGRNTARTANLGAELRRVIVLAGIIIVALVAASITLT